MPKSLVLGNGSVLVALDQRGQLRDFYYHYVGMDNHVGFGCIHRIGFLVDNNFSWLDDSSWDIKINYKKKALVSNIKAENKKLGILINFTDAVDWKKDAFIRKIKIKNLDEKEKNIKLFFHQQFKINGTSKRDTGYYDPIHNLIIHYEGRRVFAINAKIGDHYFDDYSIGNYGIEGKEGVWRDAEDGQLMKCAIEHGPVDSIISVSGKIIANSDIEANYWITVGRGFEETIKLSDHIKRHNPTGYIKATEKLWQNWINKNKLGKNDLDEEIINFYHTSLLVLRTHVGNTGEIIASCDSDMYQYGKDTYAYVWPRDAAYITMALDRAGYFNLSRNFFNFAQEAITSDGYFYHKYLCDRSVGSSWHPWIKDGKTRFAIQEDETAIVLIALKKHYESSLDLEYLASIYHSLIKKSADFLINYQDKKTGLPLPSYDLWEQDYATHIYTCATVYGGLIAAEELAELLGKNTDQKKYQKEAKKLKKTLIKYFYNPKTKFFNQSLDIENNKVKQIDRIDISSFYGIFLFGVLSPNDPLMTEAYRTIRTKLSDQTPIGGTARYEHDDFHRANQNAPANPWFITSFWKAQYEIACAQSLEDLKKIKPIFKWAINLSSPAGMMAEQILAITGEQISASPLAWSHAEYISLIHAYAEKYHELKKLTLKS